MQFGTNDSERELTALYEAQMELDIASQQRAEHDTAITNLLDLAVTIENYGFPEALKQLVDENGQLSEYLGMDLSEITASPEKYQVVADRIQEKILDDDPDFLRDGYEASSEGAGAVILGAILAPYVLVMLVLPIKFIIDRTNNKIKEDIARQRRILEYYRKKYLDNPDDLNGTPLKSIEGHLPPRGNLVATLKNLGDMVKYVQEQLQNHERVDADELRNYLNRAGWNVTLQKDDRAIWNPREEYTEHEDEPLGKLGYTWDGFLEIYDRTIELHRSAEKFYDLLQAHTEEVKDKKKEAKEKLKSKDLSKKEMKDIKKQLTRERTLFETALRIFNGALQDRSMALEHVVEEMAGISELLPEQKRPLDI